MSTPAKPRQSTISRSSGIPTPGRSRSVSSANQQYTDIEYTSLAEAIKANDPAQHRPQHPSTSSASLNLQSGRRSVAGRPSSSTSSNFPKERAKTPASARPPSRHSDVFTKSTSRSFDVGVNVRIESLGYEGTLRYVGEIDGKAGVWAGVELKGGFSGKGKNNGTVNGKQYFPCPENCGVFVSIVKLSPPTVGPGAMPRPSSVASARGGRVTPAISISGQMTPSTSTLLKSGSRITSSSSSISNGRITPSNSGRVTPVTPSARVGAISTPHASRSLVPSNTRASFLTEKITAGSRASKYMSMTAKQLNSRDAASNSPTRHMGELENPVRMHLSQSQSSPTRPSYSPLSTPRPGVSGRISGIGAGLPTLNKSRTSLNTPRARIPSAVAMPPPASPVISSSISTSESFIRDDEATTLGLNLEAHSKMLQERIATLTSGKTPPSPRSESATSFRSSATDERNLIDQLQSRIDALEYDNERLRSVSNMPDDDKLNDAQLQLVEQERDEAVRRIAQLEAELLTSKNALQAQSTHSSSLEQDYKRVLEELESLQISRDSRLKELQEKLDDDAALVKTLKDAVDRQTSIAQEQETLCKTKENEVAVLELRIEKAYTELQEERNDLGAQIGELRMAGQETIALYEERLSAADSRRYELESRITSLEAGIQAKQTSNSPTVDISSATQIDNETLREQVLHLQRKISTMEDIIEDAHAMSEKEEVALRERMKSLKEKEDGMKKELNEGRKEVERMVKSEAAARNRVEEIEEAIRESTVALENARAEVEGLRAELANLDGLVASSTAGDLPARVAEFAQRASSDRARYNDEITKLQDLLEQYRTRENLSSGNNSSLSREQDIIKTLEVENATLHRTSKEQENKLEVLTQTLNERSNELDSLRKKVNRDVIINNGVHDALRVIPQSSPIHGELPAVREEITGLRHIVQELQKENLTAAHRITLLESENQLLTAEADQLRQEVQILEENLDQNMVQEDHTHADGSQHLLKEQSSRFEMELDQLRKRLADAEIKNARSIHNLNKEISELEALVESKIYREDELEQELERLKEKLARQKKFSKSTSDTLEPHPHGSLLVNTSSSASPQVCEICERPGHDIFSCNLLKAKIPTTSHSGPSLDLFCADCESHGHAASDCPHSLEVF